MNGRIEGYRRTYSALGESVAYKYLGRYPSISWKFYLNYRVVFVSYIVYVGYKCVIYISVTSDKSIVAERKMFPFTFISALVLHRKKT